MTGSRQFFDLTDNRADRLSEFGESRLHGLSEAVVSNDVQIGVSQIYGYAQGEAEISLYVLYSPHGCKAEQGVAVAYRIRVMDELRRWPHGDGVLCEEERHLSKDRVGGVLKQNRDHGLVFVDYVEPVDCPKRRLLWWRSVARLAAVDEVPDPVIADALDLALIVRDDFSVRVDDVIGEDWELGSGVPVRWLGYLPRKMIKGRPEVVNAVANETCPSVDIRRAMNAEDEAVFRSLRVTLYRRRIGVTVDPSGDVVVNGYQVFFCPAQLGPSTDKTGHQLVPYAATEAGAE